MKYTNNRWYNVPFDSIRFNILPFVADGAKSDIQGIYQIVGNQKQPRSHIQFHFEHIVLKDLFFDGFWRFLHSTAISVFQDQHLHHDSRFSFSRGVLMASSVSLNLVVWGFFTRFWMKFFWKWMITIDIWIQRKCSLKS